MNFPLQGGELCLSEPLGPILRRGRVELEDGRTYDVFITHKKWPGPKVIEVSEGKLIVQCGWCAQEAGEQPIKPACAAIIQHAVGSPIVSAAQIDPPPGTQQHLVSLNFGGLEWLRKRAVGIVSLTNANAVAVAASKDWCEMFGEPGTDEIAPCDSIHPDDVERVRVAWLEMLDGEHIVGLRYRYKVAGEYRWFTTDAAPVDVDGAVMYCVVARLVGHPCLKVIR